MTTLIPDAIKLRYLINQLTKQEYTIFVNKLIIQNKADLITSSIFHYFTQTVHAKTNQDSNDLEHINSILTNIIQSRKNKPKSQSIINTKLNELPPAIIGYIASNLNQSDYLNFEKTNRAIFIGCNTPNMLIELDLKHITNYSSINLTKFRSVKRFRIDLTKFNEFTLPNNGTRIMNRLVNLTLNGNKNNFDIETFLNETCINMKQIKSLSICNLGGSGGGNRFNVDKFYELMTVFSNVECIHFKDLFLELPETHANLFATKLEQLCPNINGLSVIGGNAMINNALINTFGNNLLFLAHCHNAHQFIDFSNINFNKLRQLNLKGSNLKTINDTLHSSQNLETVVFHASIWPGQRLSGMQSEELKKIIPEILKFKSLYYLEIEANDQTLEAVLNGIGKGLFETVKYERKQIKIRICAQPGSKININKMIFNIPLVIHWLDSSNLNGFMLILDMNEMGKNVANEWDRNKILNDLNNMSVNVGVVSGDGLVFVITNKTCGMNGFGARYQFAPVWIKT